MCSGQREQPVQSPYDERAWQMQWIKGRPVCLGCGEGKGGSNMADGGGVLEIGSSGRVPDGMRKRMSPTRDKTVEKWREMSPTHSMNSPPLRWTQWKSSHALCHLILLIYAGKTQLLLSYDLLLGYLPPRGVKVKSFVHTLFLFLSRAHYVSGTALSPEDSAVNKPCKCLLAWGLHSSEES